MKRTTVGKNPIDTCQFRDHVRNKENWSAFNLLTDKVNTNFRYNLEDTLFTDEFRADMNYPYNTSQYRTR
jgi:hypothetical protein